MPKLMSIIKSHTTNGKDSTAHVRIYHAYMLYRKNRPAQEALKLARKAN